MKNSPDLEKARSTLEKLRRTQFRIDLVTGLGYALALIVLIWLAAFTIEAVVRFAPSVRDLILYGSILTSLSLILFVYIRLRRDRSLQPGRYAEEWWALKLGQSAPDKLRDRLLNALQVYRPTPVRRENISDELAQQALYLAVAELDDVPYETALQRSSRKYSLLTAGAAFFVAVFLFVVMPTALSGAADRLFHPGTTYTSPPPFVLTVDPAGGWAYRGEPVIFRISVEAPPLLPPRKPGGGEAVVSTTIPGGKVDFVYRFGDGRRQVSEVAISSDSGSIEFNGFPSPIDYLVRSGEVSTDEYHLDIVTRPRVAELQYRLFPPKYSRLPMVVGNENVGDVEALPGSRLEVSIRSTKPVKRGWLTFLRTGADSSALDSLPLKVSGLTGSTVLRLMREGCYKMQLQDKDGHANRDPITYRIRLLSDHDPVVRITQPSEDVILGDNMRLMLRIEGDDDYGVNRLDLEYRLMSEDSTVERIPLDLGNIADRRSITVNHLWNLADMTLFPGDVLEYWAAVWDNDNVLGPKRSESERRLVRLPSIEEIIAGVEQSEEESIDQAARTLEAARELGEEVREIIEEMRRNPDLDWEKQREMETAMQDQQNLEKQIEELSQKVKDLIEKLEKHDLATLETLEKYRELQELIAEIATPELMEAMEKLKEAIASQDPDKVRQALEQFDMNREEFLEQIDRSLNILRQLQLERRMDELVRFTEELLHRQEDILDHVDEGDTEELASHQESLAVGMEMLNEAMRQTRDLAEEVGETGLAAELDSLLKDSEAKDISGRMKSAAEAFSKGQRQDGRQSGEQNARDLADLSAGLERMVAELKERRKADLARKLRRIVEELLIVSNIQEELTSQSSKIGTSSPRYRSLAGMQEDIRMALQGIISRLFAISKETFFVTPDLGAALGNASSELERALAGYSDRRPRSVTSPQQKAMGELNRSALKILNTLDKLESASSSSGYEEMLERLSQMAAQQQGLNQQSMPMPGMGGEQQMPGGDQLARMAAEQRALQQQMEQLSEDGQGMQEILGDLDGIAKSMGEVAEDMEDQNIDERTRRLQRQIVNRLLDATRSAKEREYSRRRESKVGRELSRKSPPGLMLDQDRDQLRRDLLRALQEGYTRDYRQLIRMYFQSLEKYKKEKK